MSKKFEVDESGETLSDVWDGTKTIAVFGSGDAKIL